MNCTLCLANQRTKNKCSGCNAPEENRVGHVKVCKIKNCEELVQTQSDFCYKCTKFPCKRMKQLDKRYTTKYGVSLIKNLQTIHTVGLSNFNMMETEKWTCPSCGSLLCVHRDKCLSCDNLKQTISNNN
jgi:hypothetical protein